MALIGATITINFIANYAGPHRVCWRIQGSGDPYNCSVTVGCVGSGTTCQALINPIVNTTSCDGTVIFEGYIQSQCEDILSTNGRLLWTAPFVPNQVCDKFNITCESGGVIATPGPVKGNRYELLDLVTFVRDGGDPILAPDALGEITAIGPGVINSITSMLSDGLLYAPLDTITITGGSGIGATIRVDTVGGGGNIITYTLIANGSLYYEPLAFDITSGGGAGADFEIINEGIDYEEVGAVLGITVLDPGSYGIVPLIDFTSTFGNGADYTAVLGGCPIWDNVGLDCNLDQVDIAALALGVGETFSTCLEGGINPVPDPRYVVDESGCCIPADTSGTPCTDHHIDNTTGGNVNVHITNCGGDDEILVVPNGVTAVCLVTGGYIDPFIVGVTITDEGTACI